MIHIRGDSVHVLPQKREGSIIGEEDETQHLQRTDASFSDLRMITDATLDDTEVMRKQAFCIVPEATFLVSLMRALHPSSFESKMFLKQIGLIIKVFTFVLKSIVKFATRSMQWPDRRYAQMKKKFQNCAENEIGRIPAVTTTQTAWFAQKTEWNFKTQQKKGERVSFPVSPRISTDTRGLEVASCRKKSKGSWLRAAGVHCSERKRKILILMSDTGGGHRASARALEAAFNNLFPGQLDCMTVDIWTQFAPWPYNQIVPLYQFLASNPMWWKAFWETGKFPPTKWIAEELTNLICHSGFKKCILDHDPDIIISVHPLCQDVPLRVLKSIGNGKRQIPFATVVTDLGSAHPAWFDKGVDLCFVPSDPVQKVALKMGLRSDQIRQHGLPIRPGFWKVEKDKESLRKELGLVAGVRTVLIVGGGDGIGNLLKITESLVTALTTETVEIKSQVLVVCGKNEKVRRTLELRTWHPSVNVIVEGFVHNMEIWMGASDCLVTKAGPGSIAEASTRGLPVMLFNFLPGQEEGNVPFVIDNGFGDYKKDPKLIGQVVAEWLTNENLRKKMSKKALDASRPSSTASIAKEIGHLFGN